MMYVFGNKVKKFFEEKYHIVCIISVFCYAIYVLSQVILSSDDYTYKQVAICNISEIIDFLKWHIIHYNGRTLIHILIIAFLRYDIGFILWKFICAIGVACSVTLIGKITSSNKKDYKIACAYASVLFITVGQIMFNRSIFWLSGSFNYFFPTLYTVFLLFMAIKHPDSKWIYLFSFIGGALNEQNGMMAVGIFLMLLMDDVYKNKRLSRELFVRFILALFGYLSVMLSPGTFSRGEKQGEYTVIDFLRNTITIIRQNVLANKNTLLLMICVTAAVIYWLFLFRKTNKFTRVFNTLLICSFFVLTLFNITMIVFWHWNEKTGNGIKFNPMLNFTVMTIWFLYAAVFFISILYSTFYIYIREKTVVPFITVVLALGSNYMMVISKKLVYRYCTAGIFMLIIFVVFTILHSMNRNSTKNCTRFQSKRIGSILKVSLMALCIMCAALQAHCAVNYLNIANPKVLEPLDAEEMKSFENELSSGTYYSSVSWMNLHDITDFSHYQADDSAYRDTNFSNRK